MNPLLDTDLLQRLVKLLGMLGSPHDGERAAAGAKADALIRSRGLTWDDVVNAKRPEENIEALIDHALRHGDGILDPWQRQFLHGIRGRRTLSERQRAKLDEIADLLLRRAAA